MTRSRTVALAFALALAAGLATAPPLAARGVITLNGHPVEVQGTLPQNASAAIIVIDGKAYEIKKVGAGNWATLGAAPDVKGAKGIVILDKSAYGIVVIDGKPLAIKGGPPAPGASKAIIVIDGKGYAITRTGQGWKTADGKLPDAQGAQGIIIDGGKVPDSPVKKGAMDDLPGGPKGGDPAAPKTNKDRLGFHDVEEKPATTPPDALKNFEIQKPRVPPSDPSRRGGTR